MYYHAHNISADAETRSMNLTVTDAPVWRRSPNWLYATCKPARRVGSILACSIRKKLLLCWGCARWKIKRKLPALFAAGLKRVPGLHVKRGNITSKGVKQANKLRKCHGVLSFVVQKDIIMFCGANEWNNVIDVVVVQLFAHKNWSFIVQAS